MAEIVGYRQRWAIKLVHSWELGLLSDWVFSDGRHLFRIGDIWPPSNPGKWTRIWVGIAHNGEQKQMPSRLGSLQKGRGGSGNKDYKSANSEKGQGVPAKTPVCHYRENHQLIIRQYTYVRNWTQLSFLWQKRAVGRGRGDRAGTTSPPYHFLHGPLQCDAGGFGAHSLSWEQFRDEMIPKVAQFPVEQRMPY